MAKNICSKRHSTLAIAKLVLDSHPTDYTRYISGLLEKGDYASIVGLPQPTPSAYLQADLFRIDYMAYNLLRKFDSFDLPLDKRANAIEAFRKSEEKCLMVNKNHGRLPAYAHRELYGHDYNLSNSLEAKIFYARELIAKTLGKFEWNKAHSRFGFSGGASTRLKRASGHPFYKFQGKPEVTRKAAPLAICDIRSSELWANWFIERSADRENPDPTTWVTVVDGSRAETVPKDSKTERFICLEPEMNMRMQLGVGNLIRGALLKNGINLRYQGWNSYLAKLGSVTGSLATVDLKGASDSISLSVVRALMPDDWYDAICLLRSETTSLDGESIRLEKVSSMGNGFTFELETLIFWALCKSVLKLHCIQDTRLAVYGDDIVIHNSAVEPLELLLTYVGFEFNTSKTHVSGPFRESCGEHYFYGDDVSPFYIKEPIESEDRYYWFLNSYADWLKRAGIPLTRAYRIVLADLKKSWPNPCYVPLGYGFTAGIEVAAINSRAVWSLRKQAYLFRSLSPVRVKYQPNGRTAVLAWLDSSSSDVSIGRMVIEKGDAIFQRFWRKTSQWS